MKSLKKLFLFFCVASGVSFTSASLAMNLDWVRNPIDLAIKKGNIKKLTRMLEQRELDPNQEIVTYDQHHNTRHFARLLKVAVKHDQPAVVRFLLKNGADATRIPDLLDKAMFASPAIVADLLNHGIDPNAVGSEDMRRKLRAIKSAMRDPEQPSLSPEQTAYLESYRLLLVHGHSENLDNIETLFSKSQLLGIKDRCDWAFAREKLLLPAVILEHTPLPPCLTPIIYDYYRGDSFMHFDENEYLAEQPGAEPELGHCNCIIL